MSLEITYGKIFSTPGCWNKTNVLSKTAGSNNTTCLYRTPLFVLCSSQMKAFSHENLQIRSVFHVIFCFLVILVKLASLSFTKEITWAPETKSPIARLDLSLMFPFTGPLGLQSQNQPMARLDLLFFLLQVLLPPFDLVCRNHSLHLQYNDQIHQTK